MFNLFKKKKPVEKGKVESAKSITQIYIKYSYEWKPDIPNDQRDSQEHPSRPFCKKMMELKRLYSRADIETISERLGYSVFDRCGGDDCRHQWKSNIIVNDK